jgi:hypothetical protein
VRDNQRIISRVIQRALEHIMLSDLTRPLRLTAIRDGKGNIVPMVGAESGRTQ